MSVSQHHRWLFDQLLCHAALLVERLLFFNRNQGLLPRVSNVADPLGPLVISDEDVGTILAGFHKLRALPAEQRGRLPQDPQSAALSASRQSLDAALAQPASSGLGFVRLLGALDITGRALDAFILAIAPDWDARIGRLFGFLNNDATRQRPTLGHLHMALQDTLPGVDIRDMATLERKLLRAGLLTRESAVDLPQPGRTVYVPAGVVALSLVDFEDGTAAGRMPASLGTGWPSWDDLHFDSDAKKGLRQTLLRELRSRPQGSRRILLLEGTSGSGRSAVAAAAAQEAGFRVEQLTLVQLAGDAAAFEQTLNNTFLRAKLAGAVLILRSDGTLRDAGDRWRKIWAAMEQLQVPCFVLLQPDEQVAGDGAIRFLRLSMPRLEPADRRAIWEATLARGGLQIDPATLTDIVMRYDVTPGRIFELASELHIRRSWEGSARVELHDVRTALREITSQRLKELASLYVADSDLEQLVLQPAARMRLQELINRLRYRYVVLSDWRFGGKSARGRGVSALFAGPPGTGKTAAAAAVAKQLEIDLYVVDLSRVMSKWVGETEQNLARIFSEAEASNVALLFDEADSLFGKRSSEVKSASDRYANLTVNYLLQRMESYSGLAILTTNLESAIDSAFSRRITTRICFDTPDETERTRLWHELLPAGVRFAADVDLSDVVRQLEMPGARIRTALLRAAFSAAAGGRREPILTQADILSAAAAEYEDMGRLPALMQPDRSPARNHPDDSGADLPDEMDDAGANRMAGTPPATTQDSAGAFAAPVDVVVDEQRGTIKTYSATAPRKPFIPQR